MASVSSNRWPTSLIVLVVASATVLSLAMGLRQTLGLFQINVTTDLGISAATFGFAMAIQNLAWGLSQPFVGALSDKLGSRPIVLVAGCVYALGLFLTAKAGGIGLQVGGGLMIGLALSGLAFGVMIGAVSRAASSETRPTAVAIVSAAGSLGTFVLAPIGQYLIQAQGWQTTLLVFAAIALLMAAIGFILDGAPPSANGPGQRPDAIAALREAVAHPGYLLMTLAFFACGFQLVFIVTHLPKYLVLCGIAPGVGATALALIGLCNAVGTLVLARLGARYGNKEMLAAVYLLRTLAIAAFVSIPVSTESTLMFAAAMGFLWLGVAPLVSALLTNMFGLTNFGTLHGVMFLSHQIGSFLGAWLGGLSYDLSGSYTIAWMALIGIGAIAALVQISMDERPRPILT